MRHQLPILSAYVALSLILGAMPAAAEVLRAGGTGGATALLEHLGKPFTQQTGIAVDVVPSLGSGGGISAAADDVIDIAVSGRPLSATELGRGLLEVATVRTPYVLATSRWLPPNMTEGEIVGAFAAASPTWADGSPIKLVLRPRAESDNEVLVSLFPGMAAALDHARQRPDLPIAATDQDNADMAEALEGSLIGTTYTQITMESRNLRLISINGITPTLATFESGTYRYAKALRIIHRKQPAAVAARFVQFLRSDNGVRALREAGCLPGSE